MIAFGLDKESFIPFYRQIIDMVLAGISSGALLPGERLPTIRELAVQLGVNPNTVVKAYSQMELQGVVDTQQGSGVYVKLKPQAPIPAEEEQRNVEALCRDFVGRAQMMNIDIHQVISCLERIRSKAEPGPAADRK